MSQLELSPLEVSQLRTRRGVTLIEMMVVVAIIGAMAAISFPAASSGLDALRLHTASDSVAAFLNSAANRAERRQDVLELVLDPGKNRLALYSSQPGFTRTLEMPAGVKVAGEQARHLFLLPGASFPQFAVELVNAKGARQRVTMDPITGAPHIASVSRP